jgi:hypothetical protein
MGTGLFIVLYPSYMKDKRSSRPGSWTAGERATQPVARRIHSSAIQGIDFTTGSQRIEGRAGDGRQGLFGVRGADRR